MEQMALPGESVLTFGVRQGAGFVTLAARDLSPHQATAVLNHIAGLTQRVSGCLVLDITMVRPVNCSWINGLIDLDQRCRHQGGMLVLAGVPDDAQQVIEATGLAKVLAIAPTRADALELLTRRTRPAHAGLSVWNLLRLGRKVPA